MVAAARLYPHGSIFSHPLSVLATLLGSQETTFVLLLQIHVVGNQPRRIMTEARRDAVSNLPDLIDNRITLHRFHDARPSHLWKIAHLGACHAFSVLEDNPRRQT